MTHKYPWLPHVPKKQSDGNNQTHSNTHSRHEHTSKQQSALHTLLVRHMPNSNYNTNTNLTSHNRSYPSPPLSSSSNQSRQHVPPHRHPASARPRLRSPAITPSPSDEPKDTTPFHWTHIPNAYDTIGADIGECWSCGGALVYNGERVECAECWMPN